MKTKNILMLGLAFLATAGMSNAQVTKEDYLRGDSTSLYGNMVYNTDVQSHWIPKTDLCWYSVKTRKGTEYKLVDAAKAKVTSAFNQEKLAKALSEATGKTVDPYQLGLGRLELNYKDKVMTFEFGDSKWECSLKSYKVSKQGAKEKRPDWRHWASTDGMYDFRPVTSPDKSKTAFIRDNNVYVKDEESGTETQLSFDGSTGEFYSGRFEWSPDSKKIATVRIRNNEKKYYYMVESSPKDQLQPKLHKQEYLKPGDALPISHPCLFNVETMQQVPVDGTPFELQWSLEKINWEKDSKSFTFEFNQRGHKVYQVVRVDGETGEVKIIIEEKFKTFVDYSNKIFRHDVEGTNEIIWGSERDGWNHLYLFDGQSGKMIQQITKGNWVVRRLLEADDATRTIYFTASGKNEGEDPYFIHYYKVGYDGKNLTEITPGAYDHSANISDDHKWLIDTYSTVSDAPVSVLRDATNGKEILKLEEADITDLVDAGWSAPEVFVTKGRDGKTDIWGNIYYPSNYDSTKTYPVLEYIYAGPHGQFAQKSFRPYLYYIHGLAELGFIIVQCDGMGTNFRSKAFHDVCYQDLKDGGFPDRIKWIKAAADKHPAMDTTRVGIYGGSAGGQVSTAALLFHPEFYDVAVSSCGCHDNRIDKMWWNEMWLGYPIGKQYEDNSNVCNAYRLQGNLMLIVGELDTNVDPASTMQVADALIKADKDFELVVLPGVDHTLGGNYGERKRRDFFVQHLYHQFSPLSNMK